MSDFRLSEKKLYKPFSNDLDNPQIISFVKKILAKDSQFFWMAAIYGVFIALLSLAVPISVQLLISSVAFTALLQPIVVLGIILLILLVFSGVLNALQFYVNEIFQRRFFARISSEIGMNLLRSQHQAFEESNQAELVNRFFDVVTIQKIIPRFFTQTFSLLLQTLVGLILIAFYHPALLLFSILVIIGIYFIWSLYGYKGMTSSFYESRRKYDVAGWLEDIARSNNIFKSDLGQKYAKFKIDFLTNQYVKERKNHFKNLFSQVILLLALYAISSTLLLILGGWLVLKGQLTLGQLVASELILSTVLYGISQFGKDFDNFYDLVAACEKLSQFYNIPLDKNGNLKIEENLININFKKVGDEYLNRKYFFDFELKGGKNYIISTEGSSLQKLLTDFLNGLRLPKTGSIQFNGNDLSNLDCYNLRSKIAIIDNSPLLEGTIEEYLTFNNQLIKKSQINDAIHITGFDNAMSRLGLNLESRIIPSGWPFSESEKILLKVARTILLEPKIIIVTEVLDMLGLDMRKRILQYLTKSHQAMVVYFSNRRDGMMDFDEYIFIDHEKSLNFSSIEDLDNFEQQYFLNRK